MGIRDRLRRYRQGSVLVEIDGAAFRENPRIGEILEKSGSWEIAAVTIGEPVFRITDEVDGEHNVAETPLAVLRRAYEQPLAKVYPPVWGSGVLGTGDWGLGTGDSCSNYQSTVRKQYHSSNNTPRSPIPDPH
jgi:hypothetical protein